MSPAVIRAARQPASAWRHVCLTLVAFALMLKVLVPAGFMVGPPSSGLPFPLVLCTSQGPLVVDGGEALPGHHEGGRAPGGQAHDSPCAFAGHGAGAPPPSDLPVAAIAFVAFREPAPTLAPDVAPGRGLAGPPLPARGPPTLRI